MSRSSRRLLAETTKSANVKRASRTRGLPLRWSSVRIFALGLLAAAPVAVAYAAATVIATIGVGSLPFDIVRSSTGDSAYVTNFFDQTISVIDTASLSVTATVGVKPFNGDDGHPALAIATDDSKLYVANVRPFPQLGVVSVIDTASNTLVNEVDVGINPRALAVTPSGQKLYVLNQGANSVSVVSTATETVTATIPVALSPFTLVIAPDGGEVFFSNVSNSLDSQVSVIDTASDSVVADVTTGGVLGEAPVALAINGAGTTLYAVNRGAGTIAAIDVASRSVVATIPVGFLPGGVAISPDDTLLYATNSGDSTVTVIDATTNAVLTTVAVGAGGITRGVAVTPDGAEVFVGDGGLTVSVIATATNAVTETITVSGGSRAVVIAPDGGRVYVVGDFFDTVDVIERELTVAVAIDIKPDSLPNSINPRSNGVIPVAVLGSADFDAPSIDVTELRFGPDGAPPAHAGHLADVDGDGIVDLLAHFRTQLTGISSGDIEACLTGLTTDSQSIAGCDSIRTVGR